MSRFIAALPMYDWPEERASTDAVWARLRGRLAAAGIEAPIGLVRRNAELPPVAGGIRDVDGRVIAPDPASLPPDELDLEVLWRHPDLLLAQACWGPLEAGLADHVRIVGQPSYDGVEGGRGPFYSSAIIMRRAADGSEQVAPPFDGAPLIPRAILAGTRLAYNAPDSMSGLLALKRDLKAAGDSLDLFHETLLTGSHRASILSVAEGRADVCAVDCRTWHIARLHEKQSAAVRVLGWTGLRKGLPFIASRALKSGIVEKVRAALAGK